MTNYVYSADEIFQNIEGDDENVLMNIPPEIAEELGWKPGDVLKIEVMKEGGISIRKVENE
jgi:AbrB family looped-hinge helix DNA binding protein